jgi:Zn-dependent protease/CBS domain-containing protein
VGKEATMGGKNSLTVFRVRGIPVRLHFTFALVLPYLAWVIARSVPALAHLAGVPPGELALPPLVMGAVLALCLFACVLVHEFAHVFVGERGGARVSCVTLMLVGGVSEVTEFPRRPLGEAAMALAGPLASLALSAFGFALFEVARQPDLRFGLHYLGYVNLALAAFNLLPAFPMDGGRILRALLSLLTSRVRATTAAAWTGQLFAVALLAAGAYALNWVLLFVGALVIYGARSELGLVRSTAALEGLAVGDAMQRSVPVVEEGDRMSSVVDRMRRELRATYFVLRGGELAGAVTLDEARSYEAEHGAFATAGAAMRKDLPSLSPASSLVSAALLLRTSGLAAVPVVESGALVGAVSRASIAAALHRRDGGGPGASLRAREAT